LSILEEKGGRLTNRFRESELKKIGKILQGKTKVKLEVYFLISNDDKQIQAVTYITK
jgi:hypothetical protein